MKEHEDMASAKSKGAPAPKPGVVPVLVSAELMPFALMADGQLRAGIADLNREVDEFFSDKGLGDKVDPAIFIDVTTVYGTAYLPDDHVPYVQVTSAVKIVDSGYDEIAKLVNDLTLPSFEFVKVRVLTPDDIATYKARYAASPITKS
jgi:hypothetical protein